MKQLFPRWRSITDQWPALTLYQRFESLIAFGLTVIIAFVILVALYRLIVEVLVGLVFEALNPLDNTVFQTVFGQIMTVLIALEFNHTLQYVVARQQSIIQMRVVLLISLLALARKFMILDLEKTSPEELLGLAAVTLALGVTYWLVRDRDDRVFPAHALRRQDIATTSLEP
jgi:uncharacterized membrane protein (DUF373 family)